MSIDWEKFKKEKYTMTFEEKINFLNAVVCDEKESIVVRDAARYKISELIRKSM